MALGPGKYDDLATDARLRAKAKGVILLVLGGRLGSGFSMQADPLSLLQLPALLRDMADQIDADLRRGKL